MSENIVDRVPLAALRRSVFGFLIGTGVGSAFVLLVHVFDIGSLAALSARSGGISLADLGLLPAVFGSFGLVVAPAIGAGPGGDAA
ncbi:MAG: hypothetical protein OEL76_13450 [Siculibacillus sp.]|nr:hypothetical protein [Siculibacillus sp.]